MKKVTDCSVLNLHLLAYWLNPSLLQKTSRKSKEATSPIPSAAAAVVVENKPIVEIRNCDQERHDEGQEEQEETMEKGSGLFANKDLNESQIIFSIPQSETLNINSLKIILTEFMIDMDNNNTKTLGLNVDEVLEALLLEESPVITESGPVNDGTASYEDATGHLSNDRKNRHFLATANERLALMFMILFLKKTGEQPSSNIYMSESSPQLSSLLKSYVNSLPSYVPLPTVEIYNHNIMEQEKSKNPPLSLSSISYGLLDKKLLGMIERKLECLKQDHERLQSIWSILFSTENNEEMTILSFDKVLWADAIYRSRSISMKSYLEYSIETRQQEQNYDNICKLPFITINQQYVVTTDTHLIPVIDFCNHHTDPNCFWIFAIDNGVGSFQLKTNKKVKKDEELYISYGLKPNMEMLYSYGFVVENNQQETVLCPLIMLEQILQKRTEQGHNNHDHDLMNDQDLKRLGLDKGCDYEKNKQRIQFKQMFLMHYLGRPFLNLKQVSTDEVGEKSLISQKDSWMGRLLYPLMSKTEIGALLVCASNSEQLEFIWDEVSETVEMKYLSVALIPEEEYQNEEQEQQHNPLEKMVDILKSSNNTHNDQNDVTLLTQMVFHEMIHKQKNSLDVYIQNQGESSLSKKMMNHYYDQQLSILNSHLTYL